MTASTPGNSGESHAAATVPRPLSVPREGEVAPFDAGWHAHEIGLSRDTVRVLSPDPGWALLGYDARRKVADGV